MNFVLRTLLLTASSAHAGTALTALDQITDKFVVLGKDYSSLTKSQLAKKVDDATVIKSLAQLEMRTGAVIQELDALKMSSSKEVRVAVVVHKELVAYQSMVRSEIAFMKNPTKENYAVFKTISTDWMNKNGTPNKKLEAAADPQISRDLEEWASNFEPHMRRYLLFIKTVQSQPKPTSQDYATVQHMRDDFKEDARKFLLIKPTANRADAELSLHCSQAVRAAYLSTLYLAQLLQGKGDPGKGFLENNFIAQAGFTELTFSMHIDRNPASAPNEQRTLFFYKDMLLHSAQVDALIEKPENEALLNSLFLETFNLESKGKALANSPSHSSAMPTATFKPSTKPTIRKKKLSLNKR